jgi:hypothetical protein
MSKQISRVYTSALEDRMRHNATIPTADAIKALEDGYELDPEQATRQQLRRLVGRVAKKIINKNGERTVFLLSDEQLIVNVEKCTDETLLNAVQEQLRKQIKGYRTSYEKVRKRLYVLTGQITIDDLFKDERQAQ